MKIRCEQRENNQNTKKNARNSLKNKTFILFLYRKAIKKQFAMWIEEYIFIEHIFSFDTHRDQCLKSAFDFSLSCSFFPPNDTLWFVCVLFFLLQWSHIFGLITSKTCLSRNHNVTFHMKLEVRVFVNAGGFWQKKIGICGC